MIRKRFVSTCVFLLLAVSNPAAVRAAQDAPRDLKVFSGAPRLVIVHGYSTSTHWWAFLQHKIDR